MKISFLIFILLVGVAFAGQGMDFHVTSTARKAVLQIARSRDPGSKAQLVRIANSNSSAEVRNLAATILKHWSDKDKTFFLKEPLEVYRPPLTSDISHFEGDAVTGMILIEVLVDENGTVTDAKLKDGVGTNNSDLNRLILDYIRRIVYCPAKPSMKYLPSSKITGMILD